MTVVVRAPVPEDMAEIAEIHFRARRSYYRGHLPEEELAAWEADVRAHGYRLDRHLDRRWRCAEFDGVLVGFSLVEGNVLRQLQVDPAHWGRGVGHALHEECLDLFRAAGVRTARLEVFARNARARRFYAAHGWREVSNTEPTHLLLTREVAGAGES
ncbi:GNAT family N-acetyltransferase [Actinosynnema sp. NPDC020468]|uniref:GNAT family N-acetyltransferase n=1 Tax=Actinosynnema sp. NPDC020468 TaxID=3154488 RepID=UPI0033E2CF48